MHNHDGGKHNPWMMRVMMLFCALPLLLILIFGAGSKTFGASTWIIVGGVTVMIAAHFFMMGRSHKHPDEKHETAGGEDKNKDNKDSKTHSGHGCCH